MAEKRHYVTSAGGNRYYNAKVCTECGGLVADMHLHDAWHNGEEAIPRTPLGVLDLSVRVYNCLIREGYHYVEEVVKLYADLAAEVKGLEQIEQSLMDIRNFGYKSYQELTFALIRDKYLPQGTRGMFTSG